MKLTSETVQIELKNGTVIQGTITGAHCQHERQVTLFSDTVSVSVSALVASLLSQDPVQQD